MSARAQVLLVVRLALERAMFSESAAQTFLKEIEGLPEADVCAEMLVERGLLSTAQLAELVQALKAAQAATQVGPRPAPVAGRPPSAPSHFPDIPGYEITGLLGRGGMGVVYRAWQERPRRPVALKVMRSHLLTTQVQRRRFEREAQAAADLSHPGVVTIFEFGEAGGQPYFSMELVEGKPLDGYLAEHHPPQRERLLLLQHVCQAVAYAHQHGVIHRDLKPSNIMVEPDGKAKILDFGLAKLTQEVQDETLAALTMDGHVLGTVPYMAPEQTLGKTGAVDARTDVYAMGVMLYEVLTGRLPHDPRGAHPLEVMRRIREEPPSRPSTISRDVDGELETIVLKALAKEKERRYQSADALAADIGHYLAGEPVEAKRASAVYQLRKLAYRYRAIVIPAALAAFAVIATFAFAFIRVQSERNVAVHARAQEAEQRRRAEAALADANRENYYNTIGLAAARIQEGSYDAAIQLLSNLRQTSYSQFRSWEWGRLTHLCHCDLLTLHLPAAVSSVAFSPDGKRLATGTRDGTARVWDAETGTEVHVLTGHTYGMTAVAYGTDGKRLATGGTDGTARIWDVETGTEIFLLKGHSGPVTAVAFSPDQKRVAAAGYDNATRIWEIGTGRECLVLREPSHMVSAVAFSPDGTRLATGNDKGMARVWDAETGRETVALEGHSGAVRAVTHSPDGKRIATGSSDATARIWDAQTGKEVLVLRGHSYGITAVAYSPDGKRLATASSDHTARIWDAETGAEILNLRGHSYAVEAVAYSADGTWVATGSQDGTARIWDARECRETLTLTGRAGSECSVAFSPDGKRLATCGPEATTRIWQADTGRQLPGIAGPPEGVRALTFSPDGRRLATGNRDGTARIWDFDAGREILLLNAHSAGQSPEVADQAQTPPGVEAVAYSPDGMRVVTGGSDGTVRAWESDTGKEVFTLRCYSFVPFPVRSVAYSPDGKLLATGCSDGTTKIWDGRTGKEALTVGQQKGEHVAFSPDGKRLATGSWSGTARVWDAETGAEVLAMAGDLPGEQPVAYSPDGKRLATGSPDGTATIWDAETGRKLLSLKGHADGVAAVAFSPDGKLLATGGKDGMAKIWPALDWRNPSAEGGAEHEDVR